MVPHKDMTHLLELALNFVALIDPNFRACRHFAFGSFASIPRCPRGVRFSPAGSAGRRNTGVKSFCWGFKLQGLTWPFVSLTSHFVQIGFGLPPETRRPSGELSPR